MTNLKPSICGPFRDNEIFLFQQNSASSCYVSAAYKKWFQNNYFPQLEWHENSTDLKSIEIL